VSFPLSISLSLSLLSLYIYLHPSYSRVMSLPSLFLLTTFRLHSPLSPVPPTHPPSIPYLLVCPFLVPHLTTKANLSRACQSAQGINGAPIDDDIMHWNAVIFG
jgi:hypothetical protein